MNSGLHKRDSVAVYFVVAALHRLRDDLPRRQALLERVGIPPACLQQPMARLPAEQVTQIWLALTEALDDEFFAFDSRGMPRGSFALICRSLILEPTLGKALHLGLGHFALFLADIRARLVRRGRRAVIVVDNRLVEPEIRGVAEEIFLSMITGLMCWLVGRRITLDRTQFGYPRAPHGADPLLWGPLLSFDAAHTEIEFDAALLELPVVRDMAALKQFLRSAPEGVVVRFRNQHGLSARIYRRLRDNRQLQWPTQAALAVEFGLGASALRRQLEREGFTFQAIKHEVRRAIAFECLQDVRLSIAEVAARSGFQEPSAFHRAFRQWTGLSPGGYRATLEQAVDRQV